MSGFTITHEYTDAELAAWDFNNNGVRFNDGKTDNTLQYCVVTLNRNGIYLRSTADNNILNNEIYNNRTGIQITYNITNTEIKDNIIRDNWTLGIIITYCASGQDFSTLTVTGNIFDNNWYSEIYIKQNSGAESATGIFDVSDNTFTDAPVTYTTSTNTALNEKGFAALHPTFLGGDFTKPTTDFPTFRVVNNANLTLKYAPGKTLYTDASGTNPAAYATIEAAVAAASSGDTVEIAAGDYYPAQQLSITIPLTLNGTGTVTVYASTGWGTSNSTKHLVTFYAGNESSPITVNNITFDALGISCGLNAYGNAYVILNDVTVQNSRNAGMIVNGSTVTATNLNTSGNSWGAVNVDIGSDVPTGTSSVFTLVSGTLEEVKQIWSDGDHVTDTETVTVYAPSDYTGYRLDPSKENALIWTNRTVDYDISITNNDIVAIYDTINDAIATASSGDTINLSNGEYLLDQTTLNMDLTITGESGKRRCAQAHREYWYIFKNRWRHLRMDISTNRLTVYQQLDHGWLGLSNNSGSPCEGCFNRK